MIKEIYTRTPDDPNFVPGVLDYSNEIESVISQIKMLLGTKEGDVLGSYDFGVDLTYLVFKTSVNAIDLKQKIMDQIMSYVYISPNISIDVNIEFGQSGYGYDIAVVDIIINGSKAIGFLVDPS